MYKYTMTNPNYYWAKLQCSQWELVKERQRSFRHSRHKRMVERILADCLYYREKAMALESEWELPSATDFQYVVTMDFTPLVRAFSGLGQKVGVFLNWLEIDKAFKDAVRRHTILALPPGPINPWDYRIQEALKPVGFRAEGFVLYDAVTDEVVMEGELSRSDTQLMYDANVKYEADYFGDGDDDV